FVRRYRQPEVDDPPVRRWLLAGWVVAGALFALAFWKWWQEAEQPPFLRWALARWDEDSGVLRGFMVVWAVATLLMLLGLWTRASAVAVWLLSTSFATLNPYIDNAGDSVRGIILFYLILSPCGAAWSLDRRRARRRGELTGPVFVHPWPLRLLFLQMMFIYFCNGVYKLSGGDRREGERLYYGLHYVVLSAVLYPPGAVPRALTGLV